MTNSSNTQAVLPFFTLSLYRAFISTPLDGITKREIFYNCSTIQVISKTSFLELYKGIQPSTLKSLSRTVVQTSSIKLASSVIPSQLDPAMRGIAIGCLSSGIEASISNAWNVLETRFIQGQGWNVIRQEGLLLLTKGLSPTLLHRALSGAVFWSTYEKLRQVVPNQPALTGMGAGITQVCTTAPFYIAKTLRQAKNPPTETLFPLFKKIIKNQGLIRGLFLPGLAPRLTLSICTSGPLMALFEKYQIIHR